MKGLSAFFPAYNEEVNVERMVNGLRAVLPQVAEDYEIIIVNDGSKDKTGEIADRLVKEDQKVRVVHHEKNQGYGAAIRNGINASQKEYIFFTDGDNQFDVSQLSLFVPFSSQYDGVIGFRLNRQDQLDPKSSMPGPGIRLVRLMLALR